VRSFDSPALLIHRALWSEIGLDKFHDQFRLRCNRFARFIFNKKKQLKMASLRVYASLLPPLLKNIAKYPEFAASLIK